MNLKWMIIFKKDIQKVKHLSHGVCVFLLSFTDGMTYSTIMSEWRIRSTWKEFNTHTHTSTIAREHTHHTVRDRERKKNNSFVEKCQAFPCVMLNLCLRWRTNKCKAVERFTLTDIKCRFSITWIHGIANLFANTHRLCGQKKCRIKCIECGV